VNYYRADNFLSAFAQIKILGDHTFADESADDSLWPFW
jgi:hypothetical protein